MKFRENDVIVSIVDISSVIREGTKGVILSILEGDIIGKTKCPKFQNKMSKKFDMTKIKKAVQMTAFSIVVLKSV